jgi:hypothetical protein
LQATVGVLELQAKRYPEAVDHLTHAVEISATHTPPPTLQVTQRLSEAIQID